MFLRVLLTLCRSCAKRRRVITSAFWELEAPALHLIGSRQSEQSQSKAIQAMLPSRAFITGAAIAGLLTGSFAVRSYARSVFGNTSILRAQSGRPGQRKTRMQEVRIHARDRVDARPAITAARAKIPAKAKVAVRTTENSCKGKNGCGAEAARLAYDQ